MYGTSAGPRWRVRRSPAGSAGSTRCSGCAGRTAQGRRDADEITVFDSTGLAIQDLAVALAAMERADELGLPTIDL